MDGNRQKEVTMATLMFGTVTAKGKKEDVLEMFENMEDYYDKELIKKSGTDDKYTLKFEFSSNITSFFSYEYFQKYSEEYNCEIKAIMQCEEDEEDEEPMKLHYKNGEIISGLSDYGI